MTRSPVTYQRRRAMTGWNRRMGALGIREGGRKNGRSGDTDRPWEVPGLPGSSRTAVQPQGYTGLAIVPLQIGVNAVRLSCIAALPSPWFGNRLANWPCSPCSAM